MELQLENDDTILIDNVDRSNVQRHPRITSALYHLRNIKSVFKELGEIVMQKVSNHRAVTMTGCNILLILTLITLTSSSKPMHDCILTPHKQILEECRPFHQVTTVNIRLQLNSSYHCYNTKTCLDTVNMRIDQTNLVPNFLIGLNGFVYVGNGFQCDSQNSTIFIEISIESLDDIIKDYLITVKKFREIIYEGLRCGKIHHDFKITDNIQDYANNVHSDEYRRKTVLRQDLNLEDLETEVRQRHRKPWRDNTKQGDMFNLLDKRRVYNRNYRIFACEEKKIEHVIPY